MGWLAPALLVLLSVVPVIAGLVRVAGLLGGVAETPDNARFVTAPVPVIVHILSVIPYALIGAFQFSAGIRRRWPGWHRWAGRCLVLLGLTVALSGLWMNQVYVRPPGDGYQLYLIRWAVGIAMAAFIVFGWVAIRQGKVIAHRAWMTRAYALGLGAGTQVLTHLPYFLLVGKPDETARTLLMGAGWAINLIVAEFVISRRAGRADLSQG